jgi:hypothetical protein
MMGHEDPKYSAAIRRAFVLASDLGCKCGPAHLLVALSEAEGPVAMALTPDEKSHLRSVITAADGVPGGAATYVNLQAQSGARQLAESRGEAVMSEHLAIVLVDQAAPDTVSLLARAGIEPRRVRKAALKGLGAPSDMPEVTLPPVTPAGTLDRPPLPVAELDKRAWAYLCWRQDHLPLGRVRHQRDCSSLLQVERRVAWRVATRLRLDDDQRYSLYRLHSEHVIIRAGEARPELTARRQDTNDRSAHIISFAKSGRGLRRTGRRWIPSFTAGWGTWFSNRRIGIRNKWFWLRTLYAYRGAPRLGGDPLQ